MKVDVFWKYFDHPLTLEGSYSPGAGDVPYLRNGDPGYPGYPDEFLIDKAYFVVGKEKLELNLGELSEQDYSDLEMKALEYIQGYDDGDYRDGL